MSRWINSYYRIVVAVRKHIVPEEAVAVGCVAVCVDKPLDDGIVVSGLQIVETGLSTPTVAMG